MPAETTPSPTATLRCRECDTEFPVYRRIEKRGVLTNMGYVCFTGVDGRAHHLVYWDAADEGCSGETDEQEEWEVICGGCREAVPLEAADPPREPHRAPQYAPLQFDCPEHALV